MSSHGSLGHQTAGSGKAAGRHRREAASGTARRKIIPALVVAGVGAATAAATAHGIAIPAHVSADSLSVHISNTPWMY